MPTIGFEIKRKCKVCSKVFVAKTLDSYYCSRRCSNVAWKRKRDEKLKNARLEAIAQLVPDIREYIQVKEAVAMFGVERSTLYRLIKEGRVPAISIGERLTRIKLSDMERLFLNRHESAVEKEKPIPKLYSMEQRTVTPSAKYPRSFIQRTVQSICISANTLFLPGKQVTSFMHPRKKLITYIKE